MLIMFDSCIHFPLRCVIFLILYVEAGVRVGRGGWVQAKMPSIFHATSKPGASKRAFRPFPERDVGGPNLGEP